MVLLRTRLALAGTKGLACLVGVMTVASLSGCGGGGSSNHNGTTDAGDLQAETVVSGLDHPWGLAFLPDGRMLVTERSGTLRTVDASGQNLSVPITGLPAVVVSGQGGLLDVALDPSYATTPWIYWSYTEPGSGADAGKSGTTVARGQLVNGTMTSVQVIFRQDPKELGDQHFGGRLVFANDGTLFIILGERMQDSPGSPSALYAQNVATTLGKVVRIQRDGSIPGNNPNWGGGALPGLYSIGHRNPQGAALNPATGELWIAEHGPQGGDEVNRIVPGRNYGWPLVSYGCPYGTPLPCSVNGGTHAPTYEEPLTYWVPYSIAPSGMAFYTGTRYPGWQGQLFIGALVGEALWKLTLSGNTIIAREALLTHVLGRIRDVRQGPDGWLYLLTDDSNGRIVRLVRR